MQYDIEYVSRLEKLVEQLIPIYKEYYKLKKLPEPPLDDVIRLVNNKLPALLKKRGLTFTSYRVEARKN